MGVVMEAIEASDVRMDEMEVVAMTAMMTAVTPPI